MTDKEKLVKLFDEFGIFYKFDETGLVLNIKEGRDQDKPINERKVIGYSYFYTDFSFTKDGEFINVGIWE